MKIKGKKISGPNKELLVFPRDTGDDIVLTIKAIMDMDVFEKICPMPKPPMKKIGSDDIIDLKDKNFLKKMSQHSEKRMTWMILESLSATEELEWETLDLSDPSTWHLFRKELKDSGFSEFEITKIINTVMAVNSLDESKLEAARERFLLARQEQQEKLDSLQAELNSTPSGEPASV